MLLYMNMKQLGKRRNTVDKVPFEYEAEPETLRELITETVKICVREYIERMDRGEAVLTSDQIDDMARIGKKPDVSKAADTAITGFEDGLFRVFLGSEELTELDEKVIFAEGDEITFIRLTMLAGRMW